jgi:hypothetical protein
MAHERRCTESSCRGGASAPSRLQRRSAALAIAAAIALAGCAPAPGGPESGGSKEGDLTCNSAQQCRVEVTVTCAQGACRLAVNHPRVFARGNDVVWEIANKPGQSYAFADDAGIAFKREDGRSTFRCHREANGNRISCMNRGTAGEFEYAVRVAGAPAVPPLDPWVVNH